ncbi:damage-inducible protein [Streptomyces sp. NPDC048639]|uniref:damage-inducible protein n=1 Tax=Streptomyces sp. NPDC048639 TaxID=3365581 RepID=UPI00371A79E6
MDDPYAELPFPRTDMALSAMTFVQGIEEPAIFNHSLRTYLYGRFLGEQQDLQPDRDYDDELLFLGCLLHDAGLSPEGNGDQTSPWTAPTWAPASSPARGCHRRGSRSYGMRSPCTCTTRSPYANVRRSLVTAGADFDLGPEGPHTLPAGYADRIHATLPRLHAAPVLYDAIVGQALDKPHKAPPFTMPGELVRQETPAIWPTWEQLMTRSPSWNDYDGYRPKRKGGGPALAEATSTAELSRPAEPKD